MECSYIFGKLIEGVSPPIEKNINSSHSILIEDDNINCKILIEDDSLLFTENLLKTTTLNNDKIPQLDGNDSLSTDEYESSLDDYTDQMYDDLTRLPRIYVTNARSIFPKFDRNLMIKTIGCFFFNTVPLKGRYGKGSRL